MCRKCIFTRRAAIDRFIWHFFLARLRLEDSFLAVVKTMCAKPIRRLAFAHAELQHVYARTSLQINKLVLLSLLFPCFHAHNLLFEMSYAIGCRRLFLLRRKQTLLGIKNMPL